MISAKAVGVYVYLIHNQGAVSAARLSSIFKEGRDSMSLALRELRQLNIITTKKKRINSGIFTVTEIVEPSEWLIDPSTRFLKSILKSISISNYGANTSIDSDSYLNSIKLINKLNQSDFDSKETSNFQKKNLQRKNLPIDGWLPKHVCQEFSNRIWTMHIKPWNVNASQFIKAMASTRRKYGTNGEVELKVMDAFFVRIDLGKYSDPEHLWRLFLKMFPQLLHDAKMLVELPKLNKENSEVEDKFWAKRGL